MSSGWLDVAPEVIEDDGELMLWLDVAREASGSTIDTSDEF
jgi:hypothetical protein